ncbi:metalloprotease [Verticillium alfalfae VaMs.102]|uniref:Extracellular metalloprotease VDBG_07883 n=1 Tax=Verticillium alfalfae (strain VaMs.102 / ATCC MYA-4576 / FGSC 10136) TaxID=526221 RepID=MEP2_VERA1|nr:metalloprotease [Verticillium alfalfae VaMs.102]C9SSK8.1 RecName: Full=Extracellular metalloprotease VDBG_07883; Flags: Precursor [Verticillium alfalfae VaMs.102]EEY21773.1 metalloprotease [Verticillium alfalfae VaMs.102]
MQSKFLWIAAASAATAAAQVPARLCGTAQPTMDDLVIAAGLAAEGKDNRRGLHPEDPIVVPTLFHVLAINETVAGGYLTEKSLQDQLDVMNADFGPSNVIFNLTATTRTVNRRWAQDLDEIPMRRALRQGGQETLNIYFMPYVSGYLGYCTFPNFWDAGSDEFIYDGCAVLSDSLPGGSLARYNLGRTATHEIGHWFDLFHTFSGGCGCVGDMIHDTPAMLNATGGCPVGKDTCPDRPGLDPIHNYMDYSDDACMNEFTPGQNFRMRSAWYNIRTK